MDLKYIQHYSSSTLIEVKKLIETNSLGVHLLKKYPNTHKIKTDKSLHEYVINIKNQYIKNSSPLSKTLYDSKISVINNALGTHRYVSRVQGSKLKAKNEIRVGTIFKNVPESFLDMIIVHELSHFKEKTHNKAFYKLCVYMKEDYHQVEFDVRLYLTYIDLYGKLKEWQ